MNCPADNTTSASGTGPAAVSQSGSETNLEHTVELLHASEKSEHHDASIVATEAVDCCMVSISEDSNIAYTAPTDDELKTLRRIKGHLPFILYTVAFVELCERFSYYGTAQVFTNFLQHPRPPGSRTGANYHNALVPPGALGYGQRVATALTTFMAFWSYLTPIVSAYVADAHLGRYATIQWSCALSLIGHVLIIVSSVPTVLDNKAAAMAAFVIGLLFMGMGTGGFKANIAPLIAEQYTVPLHVKTLSSGERVLVDPSLTVSSVYMWFYLMINVGSIVGQVSMVYAEKFVGFWLAYLLPTVMFCLCPVVLVMFKSKYRQSKPMGSVVAKALMVLRLCLRGRWSWNPVRLWRNVHADDFWDAAKPSTMVDKPGFVTWNDAWVDEIRRAIKACNVFYWQPLYWATYNQITGNLTSQAAVMERGQVPNDLISNLNPLALLILIPLFDHVVYPLLRRRRLRFSPIKRISSGFFVAALAMIWACVVQHFIYKLSACGEYASRSSCPPAPISMWAQSGSYVLIGISEIFAVITSLEYAFTKAPVNMRSAVQAMSLLMIAVGNAINQCMSVLSADPYLVILYGVLAAMAFTGGVGFALAFRSLDSEEEALNMLTEKCASPMAGPAVSKKEHVGASLR